MSDSKKGCKSKFITKNVTDLLNESQFVKNKKKPLKRQKLDATEEEEDISNLIGLYQANAKKNKPEAEFDAKESRQKLLEVMTQQLETRKQVSSNFLKSLLDIISQLDADYEVLKENEQKLEHLAGVFVKCIKQTSSAQRQNLKALKDIQALFKKECDQMETDHKAETGKLADELEADMSKLQQQLIAETKRKQFENLRRTIFHAIQNDL
ncbi:uncharacterized protein LOC126368667 isoform X1 [Pectinophora gossypiella]|uniref:uncharacterized protein LOC126368667 isoform X1 n=1 Tax=Pectinophora gossypiella TaxID=13191 RepID=UPI00214EBC72|nr:uncharacterized protein LOC126368667 isoform X1 [Pectinophora gossypiella]